jgi:hypothetical protein
MYVTAPPINVRSDFRRHNVDFGGCIEYLHPCEKLLEQVKQTRLIAVTEVVDSPYEVHAGCVAECCVEPGVSKALEACFHGCVRTRSIVGGQDTVGFISVVQEQIVDVITHSW